jgi:hypothetical protein
VSEPAAPTAAELACGAERLVRQAERMLAAAEDPTARDIAETELQAALALHGGSDLEYRERHSPATEPS